MRVLALARVSSDMQEREGTSLEAQQEQFASYCKAHGLPSPTVRVEVISGGKERDARPDVVAVMREAEPGDVILVAKIDRWSRNLSWSVGAVRDLVRRGIGWRAIDDDVDATTSQGDSKLGIMSWFADEERKKTRERTVGARQRLRRMGYHVEGQPPLGYRAEGGRGRWKLVIDPITAPVIHLMFALCVEGRSCREIAERLRTEYGTLTGLDFTAVARRLRDRRYIGESNTVGSSGHRAPVGEWHPTHEAIVDRETWDRAQDALRANRVGGRPISGEARTASFLLRGLLHCAHCGRVMGAHSPSADSSVKHGGYYQCIRSRGCTAAPIVRHRDVDVDVERLVIERLNLLSDRLAKPAKAERAARVDGADAARARLAKRLENLIEAVAEGVLRGDQAKAKIADVEAKIAEIDRRKRQAEPTKVDRAALLSEVKNIRATWGDATVDERRRFVQKLVVRIEATKTATKRWKRGAWSISVEWKRFD